MYQSTGSFVCWPYNFSSLLASIQQILWLLCPRAWRVYHRIFVFIVLFSQLTGGSSGVDPLLTECIYFSTNPPLDQGQVYELTPRISWLIIILLNVIDFIFGDSLQYIYMSIQYGCYWEHQRWAFWLIILAHTRNRDEQIRPVTRAFSSCKWMPGAPQYKVTYFFCNFITLSSSVEAECILNLEYLVHRRDH